MNEAIVKEMQKNYSAPAYVFDIKKLKDRINYLRSNLPNNIELCYAIKANTFIIDDIENDIDRFEVCSPGEYEICKAKKINKEKILISGVYKTPEIMKEMVENNDNVNCYTIESMEQFELFKKMKNNSNIKLMIRLTSGNQFGIDENEVEEIIKNRENYNNIEIKGIQYFSGTQKISLKNIAKELELVDAFLKKLNKEYGYIAEEFEFGGGFPVFYFENSEFDESLYLKEFSEIIDNMEFKGKKILELGRSIVANSRILSYKSCRYKEK